MAEVTAAVYLRASGNGVMAAVERFADDYEFRLVERHQDTLPREQSHPGPGFTRLLDDLDDQRVVYVLVPSREHLSPDPVVQQELAALIARAGGVLVDVTAAGALGIAPAALRRSPASPRGE